MYVPCWRSPRNGTTVGGIDVASENYVSTSYTKCCFSWNSFVQFNGNLRIKQDGDRKFLKFTFESIFGVILFINATHLHYQTLGINFATDANVFTFLCFTWYALHTRSKGSDA